MALNVPSQSSKMPEWMRQVAIAVNRLLKARAAPSIDPPPVPDKGDMWFDDAAGVGKMWDGTTWQSLW